MSGAALEAQLPRGRLCVLSEHMKIQSNHFYGICEAAVPKGHQHFTFHVNAALQCNIKINVAYPRSLRHKRFIVKWSYFNFNIVPNRNLLANF